MTDLATISPDLPELRVLARAAGVAPSRMADAFNEPERMLEHITLEELARLKAMCDRMVVLMVQMTTSCNVAIAALKSKGWTPHAD